MTARLEGELPLGTALLLSRSHKGRSRCFGVESFEASPQGRHRKRFTELAAPGSEGEFRVFLAQAESADHVAVSDAERGPARVTGNARHLDKDARCSFRSIHRKYTICKKDTSPDSVARTDG